MPGEFTKMSPTLFSTTVFSSLSRSIEKSFSRENDTYFLPKMSGSLEKLSYTGSNPSAVLFLGIMLFRYVKISEIASVAPLVTMILSSV